MFAVVVEVDGHQIGIVAKLCERLQDYTGIHVATENGVTCNRLLQK